MKIGIDEVKKIEAKPGDRFVLNVDEVLSDETAYILKRQTQEALNAGVIVLGKGMELKTLRTLKIFTCNNFEGIYPVGTAAIMVAHDKEEAKSMLLANMKERKLEQNRNDPLKIEEINCDSPKILILNDGNY